MLWFCVDYFECKQVIENPGSAASKPKGHSPPVPSLLLLPRPFCWNIKRPLGLSNSLGFLHCMHHSNMYSIDFTFFWKLLSSWPTSVEDPEWIQFLFNCMLFHFFAGSGTIIPCTDLGKSFGHTFCCSRVYMVRIFEILDSAGEILAQRFTF